MPNAARNVLLGLALALAGCGNTQAGNEVDLNDMNAASMLGPV